LPGGDSQLYCGNDKYGFLHIANGHGRQWATTEDRFPSTGNWRYLAEYAISATLAYPERVAYRQDDNTFAVYRDIYRMTDERPRLYLHMPVAVSASDGKIIAAFPQTGQR
jgi:hypothetical protein